MQSFVAIDLGFGVLPLSWPQITEEKRWTPQLLCPRAGALRVIVFPLELSNSETGLPRFHYGEEWHETVSSS